MRVQHSLSEDSGFRFGLPDVSEPGACLMGLED